MTTMKFLLSLLLLTTASAANYRLQSTVYAVSTTTSLQLKTENCQSSYGADASVLDMKSAVVDFSEEEFNQALTGVFFKESNAAFYVAYGGVDKPNGSDTSSDSHYVLKLQTSNNQEEEESVVVFGKARVVRSPKQAQVLCAVPIKEYQPAKAYSSKDYTSDTDSTRKSFGVGRLLMVLMMAVVAVVLGVRKQRISSGMGPTRGTVAPTTAINIAPRTNTTRSMLTDAYYSVLDQKAGGNNPFDDDPMVPNGNDLGVSLTQEMSYNPAQQGLV